MKKLLVLFLLLGSILPSVEAGVSPEGDHVSESILWPPEIGQPSKLLFEKKRTFYFS